MRTLEQRSIGVLLGGGLLLTAALPAGSALGYLLSVIAARLLAPGEFGGLGALLALQLVGLVPATALQTAIALRVVRAGVGDSVLRPAAAIAGLVGAVAALGAPLAGPVLRLGPAAFLALAAGLVPLTLTGAMQGLLQGHRRFGRLAAAALVGAAARSAGGIAGAVLGRSAAAAFAGIAAGSLVALLAVWLLAGRPRAAGPPARVTGEFLRILPSLSALYLFTNIDLLLARAVLAPETSGSYAVGALATKVAFWLPQAVPVVALPLLGADHRRRPTLLAAVGVVAGSGIVVAGSCLLLGDMVVAVLGGSRYAALAPDIWRWAALGACLALVQLLLVSRLAGRDHRTGLLLALAAAVEVTVVAATGSHDLVDVVGIALVVTLGVLVVGTAIELRAARRPPGTPTPPA